MTRRASTVEAVERALALRRVWPLRRAGAFRLEGASPVPDAVDQWVFPGEHYSFYIHAMKHFFLVASGQHSQYKGQTVLSFGKLPGDVAGKHFAPGRLETLTNWTQGGKLSVRFGGHAYTLQRHATAKNRMLLAHFTRSDLEQENLPLDRECAHPPHPLHRVGESACSAAGAVDCHWACIAIPSVASQLAT